MDANNTPTEVNLDAFIEEVLELQSADGKECSWNDARWAVVTTVEAWNKQFPEAAPLDINNEEHYDAIVFGADALI